MDLTRAVMMPDVGRWPIWLMGPPNELTQGTWATVYDANAFGTLTAYNASTAQNDQWRWWLPLVQGTWRLDYNGRKGADRAIITLDISFDDGATWTAIGTIDMYAAAAATFSTSFAGIVVPPMRSKSVLRARALTRNASNTTGWIMPFSALGLTRTA